MIETVQRILSQGFRVFFLAAGLFGAFTGIVWGLWLGIHAAGGMWYDLPFAMAPHLWHGHEMIFGYATAALGGFFLTAVPNWTGGPGARTAFITTAAGLWLIGRAAMWYSVALPPVLVAVADLAFIPILAAKIAVQLSRRPKPQNVMFLAFLALLWVANLMVHLEWIGVTGDTAVAGLRAGLLTLAALISTLGGRITPAFTRNAMKRAGEPEAAWPATVTSLERAALFLSLLLPLTVMAELPDAVPGTVALVLGIVHAVRLSRWRGGWALRQPILIALHLGFGMLALGMALWGLAGLGLGSEVAALHVLGIGAVGGMTLAVMSRAGLGHTGRDLVAPGPVAAAYWLMAAATVLRWAGSSGPGAWYFPLMLGAITLWTAAFTLYLVAMWPVLTGPRVDAQATQT
ncbi:NnrS family protein [Jhaorihella thermophila]|uniref:Uncharacterized protein involved in response to NO n=1 Tax=Jhaorihella thermophila TaxID=488547 RepID=A0A1H5X928_9RHOB|nr:NnrS family protein [Jhaorihella thermophila]SEG07955.1 uncharacterized protein involved in response to NO [Jhaorihella thermophila]